MSIDDIGKSLRWLSYNKPNSIFDMRLYGQLKQWHDTYNARFSLYCFAMLDDYLITEMPDTYADELGKSGDWLKFGFHGKNNSRFFDEKGYKAGYALFVKAAENAGMPVTDTIRLHNWLASDEQKTFLHTQGIHTLLYPDDERFPYSDQDGSFPVTRTAIYNGFVYFVPGTANKPIKVNMDTDDVSIATEILPEEFMPEANREVWKFSLLEVLGNQLFAYDDVARQLIKYDAPNNKVTKDYILSDVNSRSGKNVIREQLLLDGKITDLKSYLEYMKR